MEFPRATQMKFIGNQLQQIVEPKYLGNKNTLVVIKELPTEVQYPTEQCVDQITDQIDFIHESVPVTQMTNGQQQHTTVFVNKCCECCPTNKITTTIVKGDKKFYPTMTLTIEEELQQLFDEKKHWFTTIDLENELQILMTPFHLNTMKIEVDPIERLMKLWIVKHGIQRTFRLPQTININQVRVHLLKDSKKVVIVAPRMCRRECFGGEELEREMMIMREQRKEECCYEQEKLWEMIGEEKLMKMEGNMYNWMQNIRCQLPKFITLRGIRRHTLSGELALCLELINEQNEMNRVVLNKCTRKLMIDEAGVICGRHEIQLPTCINQEDVRLVKFNRYNNTIMQLQLPIVNNYNRFLNRMF